MKQGWENNFEDCKNSTQVRCSRAHKTQGTNSKLDVQGIGGVADSTRLCHAVQLLCRLSEQGSCLPYTARESHHVTLGNTSWDALAQLWGQWVSGMAVFLLCTMFSAFPEVQPFNDRKWKLLVFPFLIGCYKVKISISSENQWRRSTSCMPNSLPRFSSL